ncbi:MAG TPA: hypothetical protein DEF45_15340 [Rhodopirellula sp.]|nr:hypothetical protein [Rhodopirellula sp.]
MDFCNKLAPMKLETQCHTSIAQLNLHLWQAHLATTPAEAASEHSQCHTRYFFENDSCQKAQATTTNTTPVSIEESDRNNALQKKAPPRENLDETQNIRYIVTKSARAFGSRNKHWLKLRAFLPSRWPYTALGLMRQKQHLFCKHAPTT